jgi:ABC-type lipoprotein export system ATPase subunit/bifunctional DNA-binding transcriptional regulator/antitoxin component of YhaV-PrlF toxin-antitoxin module
MDIHEMGAPSNNNLAIVCDNLVKIYKIADLEVVALQGLDLVVRDGEMLGIVGASGSGKSTLLNILGGLDRPDAGGIWTYGEDLLKFNDSDLDRYRRTMVGFVWQQSARNLIPYLTAIENIEIPISLAGRSTRMNRQKAEDLLEAVGLIERRDHRLSQLSGGEQQRIAIAVSLANDPKLLLADEPTGEVDEETSKTIYQIFQRLNRERGQTILIVSHDPGIARQVDRVVAIRDGKTTSETIRSSSRRESKEQPNPQIVDLDGHVAEENFVELTVLDSAGRLQIPKEYLEQFGIRKRVQLELREDGIFILPTQEADEGVSAEDAADQLSAFSNQQKFISRLQYWWSERRGKEQTK